jgi:dolichyl-phosphate beta-glucosyltransferase
LISVVIPAYNEDNVLEAAVRRVSTIVARLSQTEWEVIIVDDGSRDQTARIAAGLAQDQNILLFRHAYNQGKGAAVRTGVAQSRGDVVLICDADLSTPPELLDPFLQVLSQGADLVIGDRRSPGSSIERPQPLNRRIMGGVYAALARRVSGVILRDFNCGFKLFRGDAARFLLAQCRSDRWTWDVEVIALAVRAGLSVRAVPVTWRQGDRSAVRPLRAALESFADLARLRDRLRHGTR